MRVNLKIVCFLLVLLSQFNYSFAQNKSALNKNAEEINQPQTEFTQQQLEALVKPIALYPDLLLKQTLAASTFPEQLLDAAAFHEAGKDPQLITQQPWDNSVKAIANYPSLLGKMVERLDWTLNLASAFINQSVELRQAIQTLRSKAKSVGNLETTDKTNVSTQKTADGDTVIIIESADPQVVYVPSDNTTNIVYQEKENNDDWLLPVASFGVGMALGYAMADDDDDHYYYGGYYGPGFWYRDDAVDDWVDYRKDRWDDAYDFANDRQEWRQDNRDDWREYQQDLGVKRQDLQQRKQQNAGKISPEKRAEAQNRLNSSKSSWQSKSTDQKKSALAEKGYISDSAAFRGSDFDRQQATQRLSNARANPQVQQRAANSEKFQQTRSNYDSSRNFSRSSDSSVFGSTKNRTSYNKPSGYSGLASSGSSVNRAQARGAYSRSSAAGSFSAGRGGGIRSGGGGRRR